MEHSEVIETEAGEFETPAMPWWSFLVTGIISVLLALVVLRFDLTSVTTVGRSQQPPRSSISPPVKIFAPCSAASASCAATISACPAKMKGPISPDPGSSIVSRAPSPHGERPGGREYVKPKVW